MLLEFRTQNFKSFRDEIAIDFFNKKCASDIKDYCAKDSWVLRAMAFYGESGSGKSHLVQSLQKAADAVLSSGQEIFLRELPFQNFKTVRENQVASPSPSVLFEFDFKTKGTKYCYGFVYEESAVKEEWLYFFKGKKKTRIFEREGFNVVYDDMIFDRESKFGLTYKELHPRSLIVSKAKCLNSEFAKDFFPSENKEVFEWFELFHTEKTAMSDFIKVLESSTLKAFFMRLMSHYTSDVLDVFKEDTAYPKIFVKTAGLGLGLYEDQSEGMRDLILLLSRVTAVFHDGGLLLVDNIGKNIHTMIVRSLVSLFCSDLNRNKAQILFTTNDLGLLSARDRGKPILKRNQIWIIDRLGEGHSEVKPLTDYTAKNGEDIEKMFLSGRYGGVPRIQPF